MSSHTSADYLWDRSGPPDPEVEHLERVLGRLGLTAPEPMAPTLATASRAVRFSRAYLAVAATLVLSCLVGLLSLRLVDRPTWSVSFTDAHVTSGPERTDRSGRLAVGQWLETDARSRATLGVADIGVVEVAPQSRLRLLATHDGHHRLALSRGTVQATIWAPPGQFVIETPSSRAVDLGCAYTLHVDPGTGDGVIEVVAGWVAFEYAGHESFIPAGARCATSRGRGPGTPTYLDAPSTFSSAVDELDFGSTRAEARLALLQRAIAAARPRDGFSVWHLLSRARSNERGILFDALSQLVPPPATVTRERVIAGDRQALEAWWDAFELGSMADWRTWKREWTERESE